MGKERQSPWLSSGRAADGSCPLGWIRHCNSDPSSTSFAILASLLGLVLFAPVYASTTNPCGSRTLKQMLVSANRQSWSGREDGKNLAFVLLKGKDQLNMFYDH